MKRTFIGLLISAWFVAGATAQGISDEDKAAAAKLETVQQAKDRAALENQIAIYRKQVAQYKKGSVVIGRVVLDGPGDVQDVVAPMEILPDGSFARDVKDFDHPIGFLMQGYAPLDFDLTGKAGDLVDLGTIHLKPLSASELCNLTGRVTLKSKTEVRGVRVGLDIDVFNGNKPLNTPSGGYTGRQHWPKRIPANVDSQGRISATGFSPITYRCSIEAPNYIAQVININFATNQALDLGTIKLEHPKQVTVSYVVADQPPFDTAQQKVVNVLGGGHFKTIEKSYGWDLNFLQHEGKIGFGSSYGPCSMADLGEGTLEGNAKTTVTPDAHSWPKQGQSGHVYLLKQDSWKHWVLFKIESIGDVAPPASSAAKSTATPDTTERLKKVKSLYDQGLINKEEYDKKRKEIMDSL